MFFCSLLLIGFSFQGETLLQLMIAGLEALGGVPL